MLYKFSGEKADMMIVWLWSINFVRQLVQPIEEHSIIITLFFTDIFQEFMKKEVMKTQSEKFYLKLTTKLAFELMKSVKALYSIYF